MLGKRFILAALALTLTGCFSPFQWDFAARYKFDKVTAPTPAPNGSAVPVDVPSAMNVNVVVNRIAGDYTIPEDATVLDRGIVIQPRGHEPSAVDMYKTLSGSTPVTPKTAIFKTVVFPVNTLMTVPHDGVFEAAKNPSDIYVRGVRGYATNLTVLALDGSYKQEYVVKAETFIMLDDAPLYKPLVLLADIYGAQGCSMPFILAPNKRTLEGNYIPWEIDIQVKAAN